MDIFSKLKSDHKIVQEILDKIESGSPTALKTRESLFLKLKSEIVAHSKVEEAVFYATIKRHKDVQEEVVEALNEHHVIDLLLAELDSIPKDNEHWRAKFAFLKELLEHHIEEEENEIFKKAHKIIDKEEAKKLGLMLEQREEAMKKALEPVA